MVTVLCLCPVDVLDVAWSPHDRWLASCSIDNTIVIWNAHKFPGLLLLTAEIYYPCSRLVVLLLFKACCSTLVQGLLYYSCSRLVVVLLFKACCSTLV